MHNEVLFNRYYYTKYTHIYRRRSKGLFKGKYAIGLILIVILIAVVLVLALAIGIGVGASNASQEATLYNSVRIENLISHLQVPLLLCGHDKILSIGIVLLRLNVDVMKCV